MADTYEGESERVMAEFQLVRGHGSVPIKPKTEAEMQPRVLEPAWVPGMTLEELEKRTILKAFRVYGSQVATADALGISVRTVHNKLVKYGQRGLEDVDSGSGTNGGNSGSNGHDTDNGKEEGVGSQEGQAESLRVQSGNGVEPASSVAEERTLSVRERNEVQKVLPEQAARNNSGKRR